MLRTTSAMLRTRWHTGSRSVTVVYATPLSRKDIVERLRVFRGTQVIGGTPYHDWKVVASHDGRGFFISMSGDMYSRGDLTAILPLTATCRWLPATGTTRFEATIVPALSGRTLMLRVAFTIVAVMSVSLLLGTWDVPGFIVLALGFGTGLLMSGLVVPKNQWAHDREQCEEMSQFLRETLDAVEVGAEEIGERATT